MSLRLLSVLLSVMLLSSCTTRPSQVSNQGLNPAPGHDINDTQTTSPPDRHSGAGSYEDERKRLGAAPWERGYDNLTLVESREKMRGNYRLKPDRRFLLAIADVAQIINNLAPQEVDCNFKTGRWHINYAGSDVGTLSELPGFKEQFDLLVDWGGKLQSRSRFDWISNVKPDHEAIETKIKMFAPIHLLAASELANSTLAKERNLDTVKLSAHALSRLHFETLDRMEVTDPLCARALSMMAISSHKEDPDLLHDECMIAESMEYFNYGRTLAKSLEKTDPLRLYVEEDEQTLKASAMSPSSSAEARYLYLLLLGEHRKTEEWRQFVKKFYARNADMSLPVLKSYGELADANSLLALGANLMAAARNEVAESRIVRAGVGAENLEWTYEVSRQSTRWMLQNLLSEFEEALSLKNIATGPVIDHKLVACFYRSYFYSAIDYLTESYFNVPAAQSTCESFAKSLHVQIAGPAKQLEQWFTDRLAVKQGSKNTGALSQDLQSLDLLGAQARFALFNEVGAFYEAKEPGRVLTLSKQLFAQSDSRPSTKWSLSKIAERSLLSINLQHKLIESAILDGAPRALMRQIQILRSLRNYPKLRQLVSNSQLTLEDELKILSDLQGDPGSSKWLIPEYQKLLHKYPGRWVVMESYSRLLMAAKQYAQARTEIENAIPTYQTGSSDLALARARAAEACLLLGRYNDGIKVLGATAKTHLIQCTTMKAMLLEALGHKNEAEEWARQTMIDNSSQSDPIVLLVELLWRNGKYDQAADVISKNNSRLSRTLWRASIGPAFAEIFAGRTNDIESSITAMKSAGIDDGESLGELAHAAYAHDHADLAFQILSHVKATRAQESDVLTTAYRYLKRSIGREKALKWLNGQVEAGNRIDLAPYAFAAGQYELLWDFIPLTPMNEKTEKCWLLRAASLVFTPKIPAEKTKALEAAFADRTTLPAKLGQYMLSSSKSNDVMTLKLNDAETCMASFYVGWKAMPLGRDFYDDSDWYRLSVDTQSKGTVEYDWAWLWLNDIVLKLEIEPVLVEAGTIRHLHITPPDEKGPWSAQRRFGLSIANTRRASVTRP